MYKREIAKHVSSNTNCVIFLGVLLSNVVRYELYQQLKRTSRLSNPPPLVKKLSVCETFTVLEAITVRNRLRKMSRREGGRKGGREGEGEEEKEEEEEGENTCILANGVGATQHNGKYVCARVEKYAMCLVLRSKHSQ